MTYGASCIICIPFFLMLVSQTNTFCVRILHTLKSGFSNLTVSSDLISFETFVTRSVSRYDTESCSEVILHDSVTSFSIYCHICQNMPPMVTSLCFLSIAMPITCHYIS